MQAAESLGVPPGTVQVDGKPVFVLVPSDREVNMKRLASACDGRSAEMMRPQDAERLTGNYVGGISPFGQTRPFPTVINSSAPKHEWVLFNGGQRELQLRVRSGEARNALQAENVRVIT